MDDDLPQNGPAVNLQQLAGLANPLLRMLFPPPPNPLDQLRAQLLAVQVAQALGTLQPYTIRTWNDLAPMERSDHIVLGRRGAGKTALAATLAQHLAAATETALRSVGLPPHAAAAIGARPGKWHDLRDSVILVDEAGIALSRTDPWEQIALARHRGNSIVYTSQSTAALPRDILRIEASFWLKDVDPMAVRFEREELVALWTGVLPILAQQGFKANPAKTLLLGPPHAVLESPLPAGWNDRVSKAHR